MEDKTTTTPKEGIRKVSRLIHEIDILNFAIEKGVSEKSITGPEWQRLTLSKNEIFARIISIITVVSAAEMEIYDSKYRRKDYQRKEQ